MKIDPETGKLIVGTDAISPSLPLSSFLNSSLGLKASEIIRNADWLTYNVRLHDEDGELGVNLCFKRENLVNISFACGSKSWSDWSVENEQQRKMQLEGLLKTSLGSPPHNFTWGEASAHLDPKTGDAYAILIYRQK